MPNPPSKQFHPIVKEIHTIVGYAMLEYADSQANRAIDKKKLQPEELTLYYSKLHTRVLQEVESNKHFRAACLTASKLILEIVSKHKL